jgi:hypothetical protein
MHRSPWFIAFTHPINLFMLVITVAAGLISAWWLFPLGLIFWLVMVLKMAFDPALRINQMIQERNSLPQRFETVFNRIEKAQISLYNSLYPAKSQVKRAFEPLQRVVNDLVDHTYQLCVQMTPLENYQQVNGNSNPENELNQLDRLIATLGEPVEKTGYASARQALAEKVNQKKATQERLSQMDALLLRISAELESMMADGARVQTMKLEDIQQQVPGMVGKAQELMGELQTFGQKS